MKPMENLADAHKGSYYTILGTGGDLQEWVDGYNDMLQEAEIGLPTEWYFTNGAAINYFATRSGSQVLAPNDRFQDNMTALMFPLEGLDVGKLAIFKLNMQDRWFDDIVDNMRRS